MRIKNHMQRLFALHIFQLKTYRTAGNKWCEMEKPYEKDLEVGRNRICRIAGAEEVRNLLESVAQKNYPQTADSCEKTMWSIVCCPERHCADF